MDKIRFKKITNEQDVACFTEIFNNLLGYSSVPFEYFMGGNCYVMLVNGEITAGFCLVDGFFELRSIKQIPTPTKILIDFTYVNNLCDFTGYFMLNKKYSFLFTLYLTVACLFYKKSNFIYSYQISEVGLGKYYAAGCPKLVYSGLPEKLEGHHDHMEPENVEILTKFGILRIFLSRTVKFLAKKLIKGTK